ncbi:DegT/DnrJ/EryC1/StrS family aminotransferase [Crenothrix polyspora]|uniref:Aminotransferase DegT n=1 Tax=Crenothrix polyspora TaxID=360316 RepID=A0A1R4HBV6_9GAMM|nr:DegT/DnrJ/EryC1/StrS family aminotransferase [Crenothrix polyspora]SJM93521.1 Aminotransferase DegT [Crenothrix polyspora]
MDLLLDVNIVVDMCAPKMEWQQQAQQAIERCAMAGGRVWLYAGSVQALTYNLSSEITRVRPGVSARAAMQIALLELQAFSANKHWLAALASEGDVFNTQNPENEQLIRALNRFKVNEIALLTRDDSLLAMNDSRILSPIAYLAQSMHVKPVDFIDLKTQQDAIRPQLEHNIHQVLHHGQYIMGPEVIQLEEKLATYTGAKHCITVASGTEALLISLMALGIQPGDEIITTPFTFVATAEVIVLLGAKPVFVDIEPDTCNINASLIEAKITPRTKAIMPVSLYGQVADMDDINAIAAKYNLPVIEDAAQSFGAEYKGNKSCNLSTIGCTSFFPSKPLGCYGDGGAIFTNDDALAKASREIRVHGQSRRYYHTRIGVGGRMDTLQCAIILAKLERFDWEVTQRLAVGKHYNHLMDAAGITRIQQRQDRSSVFAQYTIVVDDRAKVEDVLKQNGIPTAVHYPVPLNQQPAYQDLCCADCTPIAKQLAQHVMSLPMSADYDETNFDKIMQSLSQVND